MYDAGKIWSLLIAICIALSLTGCGDDNVSPTIEELVVPNTVEPGSTIQFQVIANDADGDTLTYTWFVSQVELGTSASTVTWKVPQIEGDVLVEVYVADGENDPVVHSKTLTILHMPVRVAQEARVIDSTLVVPAGTFKETEFEITEDMISPTLELDFEVIEGKDVEILLLDEIAFKNWKAGIEVQAIYFSGRIAADRKSIALFDPGIYYLVTNNTFSILTSKTVKVQADLSYSVLE